MKPLNVEFSTYIEFGVENNEIFEVGDHVRILK